MEDQSRAFPSHTISLFFSNSSTTSRNTDSGSKPLQLPFKLRLFAGSSKGSRHARPRVMTSRGMSRVRVQSRSSRIAPFNDAILSLPSSYTGRAETQEQRSQSNQVGIGCSYAPHTFYRAGTQARSPRKPGVLSKRQIFCFGPSIKTRYAKRKMWGCVVSAVILVILLSICRLWLRDLILAHFTYSLDRFGAHIYRIRNETGITYYHDT